MAVTTYHVTLDVRGAIKWPANMRRKLLKHADGRYMTADEARDALLDVLSRGVERLPCGPCDNHDPKEGCLGHPNDTAGIEDLVGPEGLL